MRDTGGAYAAFVFLTDARWLADLQPWIQQATGSADGGDLPVFIGEEEKLQQITGFHLHRRCVGGDELGECWPYPVDLVRTVRAGGPLPDRDP